MVERVNAAKPDIYICIVGVHESLAGWMNRINAEPPNSAKVIDYYRKFGMTAQALNEYRVLPYDEDARQVYLALPPESRAVSANDKRVASIAIARNLIVVTENLRDFKKLLPEGRVQDWTRPD